MKDYNVKFVYRNLLTIEKIQIKNFWTYNKVLTQEEIERRVEEVSTIITSDNRIIGINTVYPMNFQREENLYFFCRMFIEEQYRGNPKVYIDAFVKIFHELKRLYSSQANGLVLVINNEKIASLGEKTNYMQKLGWTYYGKSPQNSQVWYVNFAEPKGVFK